MIKEIVHIKTLAVDTQPMYKLILRSCDGNSISSIAISTNFNSLTSQIVPSSYSIQQRKGRYLCIFIKRKEEQKLSDCLGPQESLWVE